MSNKCPKCGKTVYFAERVHVLDKDWHKLCFKCEACSKMLSAGQFSERDNVPYCKTCYEKKFRPKGYGFGGAADSFTPDNTADIINKS